MHYKDKTLGFSFDLPDGWRHDEGNLTLTFFGPNGQIGYTSEVIQMQIGTILPPYLEPGSSEKFLAEPGADVFRSKLGDETNVVVLRKLSNSEVSAVRDGIQYSVSYSNDTATQKAIKQLRESFQFPSREKAIAAIQSWDDPGKQAILKALKAGSPEEARRVLYEAGMPPDIRRPGYTIHRIGSDAQANVSSKRSALRKWWQFWK